MIIDQAGTYRLLEDLTLRGETNTPATFKSGMLLTVSHIDLVKKQVLGPAIPGWQFWELPVERVEDTPDYHESIVSVADVERFIESLDLISKAVHWNATEKGFWEGDQDNDGLKIALIHSEASEMLEGIRKGNPKSVKIPGFSNAEEEGADILIRLCDFFKKRGWDLGGATVAKMLYNTGRPHKHGKEF